MDNWDFKHRSPCLICGDAVETTYPDTNPKICESCRSTILALKSRKCLICGEDVEDVGDGFICKNCKMVIAPFRYPREVDADVAVHELMNKHMSTSVESTEPMKDPCIGCDKSWIDDSGWKCKYECPTRFAYLYNLMNN